MSKQQWTIKRTPSTEQIFDALNAMRLIQRKASLLADDLKLAVCEAEYKKTAFFNLAETQLNTRGTDIELRITKEDADSIEITEITGEPARPTIIGPMPANLKDLLGKIMGGDDE